MIGQRLIDRDDTGSMDGLYQVTKPTLCAGFVVKDGVVVDCAPILRRDLPYWITQAVRVSE